MQAFESLRFPLEQRESFSDLSCLTCARLASSVSNLTSPCNERTWNVKGTDTTGLSLRAGGRGFSPASKRVAPGYFHWKIQQKEKQKKSLAV